MKKYSLIALLFAVLFTSCALIGDKDDGVIAKVGEEKIMFEDISAYMDQYKQMYTQGNEPLSEADSLELIKFILENEITARVLLQEAKKDPEFAVTDSALEVATNDFFRRMGPAGEALSEEEKQELFEEMKDRVEMNIILESYMRNLSENVTPDSAEIANYYEENKDNYNKYDVKHILILVNDTVSDENAKEQIDAINAEIAAGKSFEDAAKEHSNCPSSRNGGNLGEGSLEDWDPAFSEGVKSLSKGEVSDPIKSRFGYHLIKLVDTVEGDGLDAAKTNSIRAKIGNERVSDHIESVKEKYEIEILI